MSEEKREDEESAFGFYGNWQEFMPIALTNLLLNIVTLGVYRFWAITRERRYLWSRTRFIDERFEWTGTGLELFLGFLAVALIVLVPLFVLQFVMQAMILQGYGAVVAILFLLLYIGIFYLVGVAKFRALRYRLSRSWWRGIRGGSDDPGFHYGWSSMWKNIVGVLALGLMVPWAMTSLWNERWRAMSFGGTRFESNMFWGNIFLRYILCYFAPWIILSVVMVAALGLGAAIMGSGGGSPEAALGAAIAIGVIVLLVYAMLPIVAIIFYAGFIRQAVSGLKLAGIEFSFTARSKDWLLLYLGNLGLWLLAALVALIPLLAFGAFAFLQDMQPGQDPFANNPMSFLIFLVIVFVPIMLVGPFIRYRNWRFGVRHMEASGEIDAELLTQSTTREPKQGEGLLEAFDVGAI